VGVRAGCLLSTLPPAGTLLLLTWRHR